MHDSNGVITAAGKPPANVLDQTGSIRCWRTPRGLNTTGCELGPGMSPDNADWLRVIWPSAETEQPDNLYCTLWVLDFQRYKDVELKIDVFDECLMGRCACVYSVQGAMCQLCPCRLFAECFCRGDIDPDWEYILRVVCFSFRVIYSECSSNYSFLNN